MYVDVVFPNNNEKKFLELAPKLGYDGICFTYEYNNKRDFLKIKEKTEKLKEETDFPIFIGAITAPKKVNSANNVAELVIVSSQKLSSKQNRYVIEKTKADILFGLETQPKKDSMHHKNSGLNQVLCTLAKKKKIMIGFSVSILFQKQDMLRTVYLGRASQNIRFCRKYESEMVIASFADEPYDMRSAKDIIGLGIMLGMHPKEAKSAVCNIAKKLDFNNKKKKKQIIADGIKIIDQEK